MENYTNYELLKTIINEVDPLGLIDLDTPESLDEYNPELKEICTKDINNLNVNELGDLIFQVFIDFFNKELAGNREIYIDIANTFINSKHK